MKNSSEFCIVYISTESIENANSIANGLIKHKLAACCSISQNVNSIFEWNGIIENRNECQLMCKTIVKKLDELELMVRSLHTDSVPEIIAVPIIAGNEKYLDWIIENLSE